MTVGKVFEWGLIAIAGIVLLRWISNTFNSASSGLQQTWQPSTYPYRLGGGLVYMGPGVVYGEGLPSVYDLPDSTSGPLWQPGRPRAPWSSKRFAN